MRKFMTEENICLFKKQVAVFMKAINEGEVPSFREKVCFSDLDPFIEKKLDVNVYTWLHSVLRTNLDLFELECSLYQNIYPKAYSKIMKMIEQKKVYLSREEKIKLFMEYINNQEVELPHGRSPFRFCDISKETKNTTNVGSWLEKHLQSRAFKFLDECLVDREQYPIAYAKIVHRWQQRDNLKLDDTRLQLWLKAIEENLDKETLRFCEIDKSSMDSILVESWLAYKIQGDLDLFLQECEFYKEKFPKGFLKAKFRILNSKNERSKIFLSEEERFSFLIMYLNKERTELNQNLCFCDLNENVTDTANINSWLCGYFLEQMDLFLEIISSYKNKYPIACSKLLKRKDLYCSNSRKRKNLLSLKNNFYPNCKI